LHGFPIVHRDFKSPNVMMCHVDPRGSDPCCKIVDFGTAKLIKKGDQQLTGRLVDNPVWLAPEVLKNIPYDERVDTYAYGVILYELVEREQFFGSTLFFSDIQDYVCAGKRPVIGTETPTELKNIIEKCWHSTPNERPRWDWVLPLLEKLKSHDEQIEAILGPKSRARAQQRLRKLQQEADEKKAQEKRILDEQMLNEMTLVDERPVTARGSEIKNKKPKSVGKPKASVDADFQLILQNDANRKIFEEILTFRYQSVADYYFYRAAFEFKGTIFMGQPEEQKREARAIFAKYAPNLKVANPIIVEKLRIDLDKGVVNSNVFNEILTNLEHQFKQLYISQGPQKRNPKLPSNDDFSKHRGSGSDSSLKKKKSLWPRKKK